MTVLTRALSIFLLLLLIFAPFCWITISGFKTPPEVIAYPLTLFPQQWTLQNFQKLFASTDYITTTAVREEELNRAEHSDNARL
jgi:multiple sugar transport system permease protein